MRSSRLWAILWPLTACLTFVGAESFSVRQCLISAVGGNPALVAFEGQLLYQETAVKPYNLNIPVTPAAVTFPQSTKQVAAIVKCAANGGYKVQARSGGHSYGNYCLGGTDGAVVVDLKNFQQFSMNDTTHVATIGAGMLLGDIDTHLHNAGGRAMTHGTSPQVGIGGHATIGGLGPTARQWGMALDHVLELEVVLANGTIITASETQHPQVFFAVRGAGASFGIVTEFNVRTEAEPGPAVQYSYTFGFGDTAARANLFKDWQSFISDPSLSRKFATILTVLPGSIVVSGTFFGSEEEFNTFQLGSRFPGYTERNVVVITDWLALVGHLAENVGLDLTGGIPASFYSKSLSFTPETLIPASAVDDLFHFLDAADTGSLLWFVIFDLEAGAINDVPIDATSYVHRDTLFWLQSYAVDIGNVSQTTIDFLDGINKIISSSLPGVNFGAYPGYVDPLLQDARTAYWGANLGRLEQIKKAVDPDDVFHNPQSVQPAPI